MNETQFLTTDKSMALLREKLSLDQALLQTAFAVGDACVQLSQDASPTETTQPKSGPLSVPVTILSDNVYSPYNANFSGSRGRSVRQKQQVERLVDQGHSRVAATLAYSALNTAQYSGRISTDYLYAIQGASTHTTEVTSSTRGTCSQITGLTIDNPYRFNNMYNRQHLPHPLGHKKGRALLDLIVSIANTPPDIEAIQANIDNWPPTN